MGDSSTRPDPARGHGDQSSDGWAENERVRLTLGLDATPAERIAWLEEAIALAYRTGALPRRESGIDQSQPTARKRS
jgi:hypothetical protein